MHSLIWYLNVDVLCTLERRSHLLSKCNEIRIYVGFILIQHHHRILEQLHPTPSGHPPGGSMALAFFGISLQLQTKFEECQRVNQCGWLLDVDNKFFVPMWYLHTKISRSSSAWWFLRGGFARCYKEYQSHEPQSCILFPHERHPNQHQVWAVVHLKLVALSIFDAFKIKAHPM